jgi:hypothetical protein
MARITTGYHPRGRGNSCAATLSAMFRERIVSVCFAIAMTPVVAAAQQNGAPNAATLPAESVSELTYPMNDIMSVRRAQTRTESAGRATVVETVEVPGIDGRPAPLQESVSETTRSRPTTTQTRRDVFVFDAQRQRRPWETTQWDQETQANRDARNVQNTWAPDVNGHLVLTSGRVEERTSASGVTQTNATLLVPALNESAREIDRTESTERQIDPTVVRRDSTHLIRDLNGRWLPAEARSAETRGIGLRDRIEEETIQRPDLTGKLLMSDRVVTRSSESNAENRVEIETYSQYAEGFVRADSRLALSQRISTSTTVNADGGRNTVEEVEARNPVSPNDPMRVVRRTVVTVRKVGSDRWATERQVFERDINGRLVLVANDTEETTGK